jgi:hypothetical protein
MSGNGQEVVRITNVFSNDDLLKTIFHHRVLVNRFPCQKIFLAFFPGGTYYIQEGY